MTTHTRLQPLCSRPARSTSPLLRRIHAGGVHAGARPVGARRHARRAGGGAATSSTTTRWSTASTPASASSRSTRIGNDHLAELQRNLVLSHSVGTGEPLAAAVVRLVLATKAVSLARGHSGVRPALVDALLALFNAGVMPRIPCKGSVGASGDLAPLAHLACVLIGEGEATHGRRRGGRRRRSDARASASSPSCSARRKAWRCSTARRCRPRSRWPACSAPRTCSPSALMSGALSLEAIQGSIKPFDARIHAARGQPGQIAVAAAVRTLLDGSEIVPSHADCGRVQDPYSMRCMPQVMGACLDNLAHAARVLVIEANAASDNPLVFTDTRRGDLRRQLPRRAGRLRGRHPRAGRSPRSAPSPSAASRCCSTPACRACRPSWCATAASTPAS